MFRSAKDVDGAIEEVRTWADSLPGEFALDVTDYDDGTVIAVKGTLISSEIVVSVWLRLQPDLVVTQYRLHVQHRDGRLLWSHDRHPGHEEAPGMRGPEHVHRLSGGKEVRLPANPIDLSSVRDALIEASLEHAT